LTFFCYALPLRSGVTGRRQVRACEGGLAGGKAEGRRENN
jgi:hypothetical protein